MTIPPPTKFAHFSLEELDEDWHRAHADILFIDFAMAHGATVYMNGTKSLAERREDDEKIIAAVEQELKDRNLNPKWVVPKVVVMPHDGWIKE